MSFGIVVVDVLLFDSMSVSVALSITSSSNQNDNLVGLLLLLVVAAARVLSIIRVASFRYVACLFFDKSAA